MNNHMVYLIELPPFVKPIPSSAKYLWELVPENNYLLCRALESASVSDFLTEIGYLTQEAVYSSSIDFQQDLLEDLEVNPENENHLRYVHSVACALRNHYFGDPNLKFDQVTNKDDRYIELVLERNRPTFDPVRDAEPARW